MDAFKSVKLDLAAAVSACISVALLMAALPLRRWIEVVVLALTAVAASVWVMLRTRRAVRRLRHAIVEESGHGAQ